MVHPFYERFDTLFYERFDTFINYGCVKSFIIYESVKSLIKESVKSLIFFMVYTLINSNK